MLRDKIKASIESKLSDHIEKYAYDNSDSAEEFKMVRKHYVNGMVDAAIRGKEMMMADLVKDEQALPKILKTLLGLPGSESDDSPVNKMLNLDSEDDDEITLILNEDEFAKLQDRYNAAVASDKETFEFQNKTLVTRYAKYIIEVIKKERGL